MTMPVPVSVILQRKGREVFTISPDASVADAARSLAEHGVGALVVSADGTRLDGIVSERDVVRHLARDGAAVLDQPVSNVMTAQVQTCGPDATVDELMSAMTAQRFRHVPILDGDALIGLVSIGDVVKYRVEELEVEAEALAEYVTGSHT
jgi:CBS domain-containing protein